MQSQGYSQENTTGNKKLKEKVQVFQVKSCCKTIWFGI